MLSYEKLDIYTYSLFPPQSMWFICKSTNSIMDVVWVRRVLLSAIKNTLGSGLTMEGEDRDVLR